jgi:hydroxymethylbilane synthase
MKMTAAHPPASRTPASPSLAAPAIDPKAVKSHKSRSLPLRVGSRASPLALVQTRAFLTQIMHFCPVLKNPFMGDTPVFQEHAIRTTGDIVQNRRLAEIGGKGLFAKEIHEALADGRIDFAVHSLKDLETELPPGIVLACTLQREDARDALILPEAAAPPDPANPFAALPENALIGTSSVRRQAQLLHARPDLRIGLIRGNVQTRLNRLESGEYAATLLAYAGMRRLGLDQRASVVISPDIMVPAACQGIVGVTVRAENTELRALLGGIEDAAARAVSTAERAMLAVLDGSCRTPIGGFARLSPDGTLRLTGLTASEDGTFLLKRSIEGTSTDAHRLGAELGAELRADSPASLFLD